MCGSPSKLNKTNTPAGKGAYGVVWKATDRKSRKTVALKKVLNAFRTDKDAQKMYREIICLSRLPAHPHIIKLVDVLKDDAKDQKDLYVAFDYMDSDLHAVIRAGIIEQKHLQYITYQLLKCIKHMHTYGYIHRDIKPSNILLTPQCVVKVADFGNCRSIKPGGSEANLTRDVGTRWYSAPEVLLGSKSYGKPVDMWGLGCVLGEMVTGKPLFRGTSTVEQVAVIFSIIGYPSEEDLKAMRCPISLPGLEYLPKLPPSPLDELCPGCDEDTFDFLQRLLVLNPTKRLTAEQALEHPFIKGFSEKFQQQGEDDEVHKKGSAAADDNLDSEELKQEAEFGINDSVLKKADEYKEALYSYIDFRSKAREKVKSEDRILTKLKYLKYAY